MFEDTEKCQQIGMLLGVQIVTFVYSLLQEATNKRENNSEVPLV